MAKEATPIRRRIASASIFILAALTLGLAIYLWLTPVDISRYAPHISSFIGERTGRKVSMDSVIVRFLPYPDITIKGLSITDADGPFIHAGALRLKADYLPLLAGRIRISDLDLKGATIRVTRREDSGTNIDDIIRGQRGAKTKSGFKIDIGSARLESGTLFFTDKAVPERPSFEFAGLRAQMETLDGAKRFELEGMLAPGTKISVDGVLGHNGVRGNGKISAFDLGRLTPYAQGLLQGASLGGRATAEFSYAYGKTSEFVAALNYTGLSLAVPEMLDKNVHSPKGSAVIRAFSGKETGGFEIEEARISLPGFSVNGSLSVEGPNDDKTVRARLSSTPAPLASISSLIPVKKMPKEVSAALAGFIPEGGSVTIRELKVASRLEDLIGALPSGKPPVSPISIDLGLDSLSFRLKGFDRPFSEVSGKISLYGDKMIVKGSSARYGSNTIRSLNATISELAGDAVYEASAEGSVDAMTGLGIARGLARERKSALADKLGRASVSGRTDLSVKARGRVKDRLPQKYSGSVFIPDLSVGLSGLPVSIETMSADALFDERSIVITGLSASDGSSAIVMNGRIYDYAGTNPSFALAAQGRIGTDTVRAIAKETSAAGELYTEGYAAIKLTAEGERGSTRISLTADATPAWIAYKDYIRKEEDFPSALSAFLETSDGRISIRKASLLAGSSTVELSGLAEQDSGRYDISARSDGLLLEDLDSVSPYLRSEYASSGTVSFDIKATRPSKDAHPSYKGMVAVKDGRFKTPFLEGAVERLDAAASFDGHAGRLDIGRMDVGGSDLSGTVHIEDIAGRKIRFSLASSYVDSKDIIPKERLRSLARRRIKPPVTGSGTITIADGAAWGHSFSDLKASVALGKDIILISPVSTRIDGGNINAAISYHRDNEDPLLFEAAVEASGVEIEPMLSAFGVKDKILAGTLKGRGALWSLKGAEPFSSGLNGDLRLEAESGRLWKFQVLAGIFSVVNILSIDELFEEGLPYNTLSGAFTIRDGIIATEDMSLDSDSMRMSAYGEIDLPNAKINGVLAMHPLVTIDKIVSSIPLAGYIITGRNESTASIYFGIEGPLKDADVSLLPVKSVGEGVLGILERLIKTPIRLLENEERR